MAPAARLKILIIEGELIIAADVSMQLSQLGYEVLGLHTQVTDALKTMASNRPNIVLLDIGFPGQFNDLADARLISESYQIPLVFLSSNTEEASLQSALALHPLAVIAKPFDSEDLENALAHTCAWIANPLGTGGFPKGCKLFAGGEVYRLKLPPPLET
jgi:CheY-like chemotaxis protein